MCGITGFVKSWDQRLPSEPDSAAILHRMCRVMAHRGPDDQGVMVSEDVSLGMRRLSIIDLAGGSQPISNEQGTVTVVFNGEIYNYRELQRRLEARGYRFKTNSDTESIVHAYEEYGASCVERLRGMFAFALWDDSNKRLFIARDRVGKKPLYYTVTARQTFVFGSELKSLLEYPEVSRDIDPQAIDNYLSLGYVPDPLSIFRGIHKLPPGHYLTFEDGAVSVKQYWDFDYEPIEALREGDYLEELRALLDEAVRLRLVSDVPLGAFLSGGIDSSVVVGLMSRHASQPVKTFSIGFREDSHNELKYARIAASHFGTDHHEFIVTPDICNIAPELVWHLDEPFADWSMIPTYMVSKLAREHVKVVLSGDGGDELFAGYTRYAVERNRNGFARLPRLFREGIMQPLSRRLPHGAWGRNYLHNVSLDPVDRYLDSVSTFTSLNKASLYTTDFHLQLNGNANFTRFHDYAEQVSTGEALDRLLYIDSKTYLPGDILAKVDRMSMAVSLEVRAPLLDHKLIEFVTRIPAHLKMRGLETKHILKRAARSIVPPEILNRPKQGFGIPMQRWLNQELRSFIRDVLTEPRTRERGYFQPGYIESLFEEHARNRRDHSKQLWSLFMLELWHRSIFESANAQASAVIM